MALSLLSDLTFLSICSHDLTHHDPSPVSSFFILFYLSATGDAHEGLVRLLPALEQLTVIL